MTVEPKMFPRTMSLAVHELRTPVTVVSGYLRMLLREQAGPLTEKQRKMVEEADRSCARIAALVAEMSELGRLESGELALAQQPFDLHPLVAEVAADMHEGDDRNVRLEYRGPQHPLEVQGDRVRVASAVRALLHAALRERGEPGVIVVECAARENGDRRWAVLTVGEESLLPQLRQAAESAGSGFDEWRGGLGLALPIARRVIEAHGGSLWSPLGAQSRAAAGLRLPLRT